MEKSSIILAAIFAVSALTFASVLSRPVNVNLGAASQGTPANVASSTAVTIAAGAAQAIAATSTCSSRIVSTQASGIILTFSDQFTPTLGAGAWQGPSTTVAYDSGLYGCGKFKAISAVAQVITVVDVR